MKHLIKIVLTSLLFVMITTFSTAQQELWGTATGGGGGVTSVTGDYNVVVMPQDHDGDGTSWYTCDCGGTDATTAGFSNG